MFGFGTWRAEARKVGESVKHALTMGYRHIDLSPRYGNQREVGLAFSEAFGGGLRREEVFIASKLWNTDHRRVHEALTETLNDLQLTYLDVWYVHWPVALLPGQDTIGNIGFDDLAVISETWREMEREVDAGRVRHLAVSNFNVAQLERLFETAKIRPIANQVELHPYLPQGALVSFCKRHGMQVVAYCPIGSPGNAAKNRMEVTPIIERSDVIGVAVRNELTPAQVVLKWAMQHNVSVIPKSVTPSRIEENLGAQKRGMLSPEDMSVIDSVRTQHGTPVRYCAAAHLMRPGVSELQFWGDDGGDPLG